MVGIEIVTVRTRILQRATHRFAAQGFDGTSIQQIADDVEVSKQAVLHHFASKDELRLAVIEHVLSHWAATLPGLLLGATEGDERYGMVTAELCRFFAADPDRARLLVREVLDRPAEMKQLLTVKVRPFIDAVARYVKNGQKSGEIHEDIDAEAYLVALMLQVITGIAAFDCVGVLLSGGTPSARRTRFIGEIVRSGRRSLFQDSPGSLTKQPGVLPATERRRERKS